MNRQYLRVTALAVFLYLSLPSIASAAPPRDRDRVLEPRERIVKIVKKVKAFIRGVASQEDLPNPPIP